MTRYMSNHVQTEGHNRDGKFTLRGAEEIRKEPQTWKPVYESSFELGTSRKTNGTGEHPTAMFVDMERLGLNGKEANFICGPYHSLLLTL